MKNNTLAIVAVTFAACVADVNGQDLAGIFSLTPHVLVPDGDPGGWTGQLDVHGLSGSVANVQVTLDTVGGYNGDLYLYFVTPQGQKPILLNRPGITGSNPFGYADSGFNIVLDSGASANVHDYGLSYTLNTSGQVTGTWAADGRDIRADSEGFAFDRAPITSGLNLFLNQDATTLNGQWSVRIADYAVGGGETLLKAISVKVTVVPEPSSIGLLLLGSLGCGINLWHRRRS